MTREDIIRIAQEAGIMPPNWGATENQWRSLETFAKLVAEQAHQAEPVAPPQRKPLTDKEICPWFQENTALTNEAAMRITRAIEAAHGIKE